MKTKSSGSGSALIPTTTDFCPSFSPPQLRPNHNPSFPLRGKLVPSPSREIEEKVTTEDMGLIFDSYVSRKRRPRTHHLTFKRKEMLARPSYEKRSRVIASQKGPAFPEKRRDIFDPSSAQPTEECRQARSNLRQAPSISEFRRCSGQRCEISQYRRRRGRM